MTDIVERLRRSPYERELKDEAADTLEELRTEIAKLRKALQSIVDYPDLACQHIARTALQKDQGE